MELLPTLYYDPQSLHQATGVGSGDDMSFCAKVNCKLRNWDIIEA